jgi:type IV secretion system protein VirB6
LAEEIAGADGMSCIAPPTGSGFLAATLANLDCQAQTIGQAGFMTLASSGSPLALALTALLAIFVAIIGIRFLTGRLLGLDEWVAAALKVGFVFALTASWPAYRTIVYDVVLKGPAELSTSIGQASALPGSDGGLAARLQGVDNGIMALVVAGSGRLDISSRTPQGAVAPPLADDTALGWGKTLFVASIIGSFGLLRFAGGLFLALAPLFAGFLLFDATRFLFFGWLRSLIAIAIGSIGLAVVLGVQLAIFEPWLSQALELRAANVATLSAPFELLALTLAFSLTMLGVFMLALRIAFASAAVTKVQAVIERTAQDLPSEANSWRPALAGANNSLAERSRTQEISQSVQQALSREDQASARRGSGGMPSRAALVGNGQRSTDVTPVVPLGRSYPAPSRRVGNQILKRKPGQ